jgi:hypothetical protein
MKQGQTLGAFDAVRHSRISLLGGGVKDELVQISFTKRVTVLYSGPAEDRASRCDEY